MGEVLSAEFEGRHNTGWESSRERLIKGQTYRDLSTLCIVPSRSGLIPVRAAEAIESLIKPMNQKYGKWVLANMEVADAYNTGIANALANAEVSKWKFILSVEEDNLPPPDGLLKLQEAMYSSPYAAIGGLYWTKGEAGQPMIYGDPSAYPINFIPQVPRENTLQECRGIAQGFTLYDINIFKDKRMGPPWFQTVQKWEPSKGVSLGTQDLDFCQRGLNLGYRFAVHTGVRVGHLDLSTGIVW